MLGAEGSGRVELSKPTSKHQDAWSAHSHAQMAPSHRSEMNGGTATSARPGYVAQPTKGSRPCPTSLTNMQFLSIAGDAVLLNVFDLIAVNYSHHLPHLKGLQIKPGTPEEAPTDELSQQGIAAAVESQQQTGSHGKKRKRSKQERERPEEWQQRQARQAEADKRHAQARPALEQALQLLKQHLAALHTSSLPAGQPRQQPADDNTCLEAATEAGSASQDGGLLALTGPGLGLGCASDTPLPAPELDLLNLAHMKSILHPMIRFSALGPHDPGASMPLFDTLVPASSQHLDKIAWAHETPVVLPAGSCFLISDIKELRLLIPGDLLLFLCMKARCFT